MLQSVTNGCDKFVTKCDKFVTKCDKFDDNL
jgi:hypothetical protein